MPMGTSLFFFGRGADSIPFVVGSSGWARGCQFNPSIRKGLVVPLEGERVAKKPANQGRMVVSLQKGRKIAIDL